MYISMSRYLLLCSRAVARCEKLAWVLRVQEADLRTQSGSWRQWALLGMGGRHLEGGGRTPEIVWARRLNQGWKSRCALTRCVH
mgnify:CR=1